VSELVLVEREQAVATVLLNRPRQLNALSGELLSALVEALRELDAGPSPPGRTSPSWRGPVRSTS